MTHDDVATFKELTTNFIKAPAISLGLTADTGSAQGGQPLVSSFNEIAVCANAGDAVTLPASFEKGTIVFIKNTGGASCDVFPASGDDCGAGANTAVALAAGDGIAYIATAANATWTNFIIGT